MQNPRWMKYHFLSTALAGYAIRTPISLSINAGMHRWAKARRRPLSLSSAPKKIYYFYHPESPWSSKIKTFVFLPTWPKNSLNLEKIQGSYTPLMNSPTVVTTVRLQQPAIHLSIYTLLLIPYISLLSYFHSHPTLPRREVPNTPTEVNKHWQMVFPFQVHFLLQAHWAGSHYCKAWFSLLKGLIFSPWAPFSSVEIPLLGVRLKTKVHCLLSTAGIPLSRVW